MMTLCYILFMVEYVIYIVEHTIYFCKNMLSPESL